MEVLTSQLLRTSYVYVLYALCLCVLSRAASGARLTAAPRAQSSWDSVGATVRTSCVHMHVVCACVTEWWVDGSAMDCVRGRVDEWTDSRVSE